MRQSSIRAIKNGVAVYDTNEEYKAFVEALNKEYTLTGNSHIATTEVTLTNGNDGFKVNL